MSAVELSHVTLAFCRFLNLEFYQSAHGIVASLSVAVLGLPFSREGNIYVVLNIQVASSFFHPGGMSPSGPCQQHLLPQSV